MEKNSAGEFLDADNAKALVDLIADPDTPETLRVKLIRKILEARHTDNFFKTIFEENLSMGKCPHCDHVSHWVMPEEELNKFGWVSSEKDPRVPKFADAESCPKWEQACSKKKITV